MKIFILILIFFVNFSVSASDLNKCLATNSLFSSEDFAVLVFSVEKLFQALLDWEEEAVGKEWEDDYKAPIPSKRTEFTLFNEMWRYVSIGGGTLDPVSRVAPINPIRSGAILKYEFKKSAKQKKTLPSTVYKKSKEVALWEKMIASDMYKSVYSEFKKRGTTVQKLMSLKRVIKMVEVKKKFCNEERVGLVLKVTLSILNTWLIDCLNTSPRPSFIDFSS